jgi:adenosylhomocysteine nucleosidase
MSHSAGSLPVSPSCQYGLVFALGAESGALEDALDGAIRIQAGGLTIQEGNLKGRRVAMILSGPGRKNAARATDILIDGHRPEVLVSAGFAGGLSPQLKRHDILLAPSVIEESGREIPLRGPNETDETSIPPDSLSDILAPKKQIDWPGLHVGKLLSVDRVVRLPSEKQTLFEKHQALAADMETYAVAEACCRRGAPLVSIRIIYDARDDALPPDIERLLDQKSEAARWGAALGLLWRRPGRIKDLWALKENSLICADRLAKFIVRWIEWREAK